MTPQNLELEIFNSEEKLVLLFNKFKDKLPINSAIGGESKREVKINKKRNQACC